MNIELDEKRIKRRILFQYLGDGLWDMSIGITILLFGIGIISDTIYLVGVWAAIGSMLVVEVKNRYTYPRLGYVKLGKSIQNRGIAVLAFLLLLGLVVGLLFSVNQSYWLIGLLKNNFNLILAIVFGGSLLICAIFFNTPRFFIFSLGLSAALIISKWFGSIGINLAISGGLIPIVGMIMLMRFNRLNPIQKDRGIG